MKKIRDNFLKWRHERIRKFGQWYADLIIRQLENAPSERIFNYWLNQGMMFDIYMTEKHEIYLD